MSDFKCSACSKTLVHFHSLQCLHPMCKECLLNNVQEQLDETNEKNTNHELSINCPKCSYCTLLGRCGDKELNIEEICKAPHIIRALCDLEHGLESPVCVACKHKGLTTKSMFWCLDCVEHFCQECLSFHSSLPNLDKHKTYTIEEVRNESSLFIKARELCDQHDLRLVKVCYEQGCGCCPFCISSDHVDVCRGKHEGINEESLKILVNPKLSQLKESIAKLRQELSQQENEITDIERTAKGFFVGEYSKAREKLQTLIRILLEKNDCLLAETYKVIFYKLQEIESRIEALNQKKSVLENAAGIIVSLQDCPNIRSFLELKKLKNVLKDASIFLNKKQQESIPRIGIVFNHSTNKVFDGNSFGEITQYQSTSEHETQKRHPYLASRWRSELNISEDTEPLSMLPAKNRWASELNLSSKQLEGVSSSECKERQFQFGSKMFTLSRSIKIDNGFSHTTGCDWKSENEIVIVDQKVKGKPELRTYNVENGEMINNIQLDRKPYGIAILPNNAFVVTIPKDEEIRVYNFMDNSLKEKVNVRFACHGVHYCPNFRMLTVTGENNMVLLDGNLSETRRLTLEGNDIRYIYAFNNNLFFYSDLQNNTVFSAIGNGSTRFEYTNEEIKGAAGLILDELKNVYFCGKGTRYIHVLSKSGSFLRKFEVGQNPTSLALSKDKRRICIVRGGRNSTNMADIYSSD